MTRRHREQSFDIQPMEPPCERIGECALINSFVTEACPTPPRAYDASPLLTAEQLCPVALKRRSKRLAREHSEAFTFSYASSLIEQAIADDTLSAREKSEYITGAKEELEALMELQGGSAEQWLHVGIIHSYLGAFEERALGKPISEETIDSTYRNMTELLETQAGFSRRDRERTAGLRIEIEVAGLLLFTRDPRNFPWPALRREEGSILKPYNHDSYVLREDGKIPIQVKRGGERLRKKHATPGNESQLGYSERVALVVYSCLEVPQFTSKNGNYTLSIADALIQDSTEYYTPENGRLLAAASSQLVEIIDDVEPTNLENYPKAA